MSLDASLRTALEADGPLIFYAVQIALSGATIRLLDGPGTVTIGGNTFTGKNSTYGVLAGISDYTDGVGAEAPTVTLTMHPPDMTGAALLMDPEEQGAEVKVWFGAIDRTTGLAAGTPDLQFIGEIDTTNLSVSQNQRIVTIECASVFERFFENVEGIGLNDATQQARYPGELGFEFVTLGKRIWPWGVHEPPRPSV